MKPEPIFEEQRKRPPLTFDFLRAQNIARCNESFTMHDGLMGWSHADWSQAVTGEWGEACNKMKKKFGRREDIPLKDIAHELADTVIYLDLLAARLGIDLADAVRQKFNIVSERVNSKRYI